jgi:CRP/FNR family cyclic AMP-dependent transcriptional regulator
MALARAGPSADDSVMTPASTELLGGTWFGADIPPDVRRRIAAIGEVADFPVGAIVVAEGEPCRAMGVVVSGRIALRLAVPGAGDQTIITVDEGDLFGWSALLPGAPATSTGVALLPTRALLFERERLVAALAVDAEMAAAVYQRVLLAVVRRLQATRLQLLDLYRAGYAPW